MSTTVERMADISSSGAKYAAPSPAAMASSAGISSSQDSAISRSQPQNQQHAANTAAAPTTTQHQHEHQHEQPRHEHPQNQQQQQQHQQQSYQNQQHQHQQHDYQNHRHPDRDRDRVVSPPLMSSHPNHNNPNHTTMTAATHDKDEDMPDRHRIGSNPPRANRDARTAIEPSSDGEPIAESQLMLLSRVAEAAVANVEAATGNKKRRADGELKRDDATPPVKRSAVATLEPGTVFASNAPRANGHSRNLSAVSAFSATSAATSRGFSSQDGTKMAAVLKYAMVKVKHGWENMNLNQVEADLAARSPAHRASLATSPASSAGAALLRSPPVLAPPPAVGKGNPRRSSDLRGYAPTLLAQVSSSSVHDPQTPLKPNGHQFHRGHGKKLSVADSMLFPGSGSQNHHNSREQEAVQSLLFMSSPGNTAPLKRNNTFSPESRGILPPLAPPPPSSQPTPARQPLPDSGRRERKPLPTQKPNSAHRHSLSASMAAPKRVGFPASPGFAMEVDSPTPNPKGRKKLPTSAAAYTHNVVVQEAPPKMTLPAALGAHQSTPRKKLSEHDIERMIDRAMKDVDSGDDDDDGPIEIPPRQRIKLPA